MIFEIWIYQPQMLQKCTSHGVLRIFTDFYGFFLRLFLVLFVCAWFYEFLRIFTFFFTPFPCPFRVCLVLRIFTVFFTPFPCPFRVCLVLRIFTDFYGFFLRLFLVLFVRAWFYEFLRIFTFFFTPFPCPFRVCLVLRIFTVFFTPFPCPFRVCLVLRIFTDFYGFFLRLFLVLFVCAWFYGFWAQRMEWWLQVKQIHGKNVKMKRNVKKLSYRAKIPRPVIDTEDLSLIRTNLSVIRWSYQWCAKVVVDRTPASPFRQNKHPSSRAKMFSRTKPWW